MVINKCKEISQKYNVNIILTVFHDVAHFMRSWRSVGWKTIVNMMTVIIMRDSSILCHVFTIHFNMLLIGYQKRWKDDEITGLVLNL